LEQSFWRAGIRRRIVHGVSRTTDDENAGTGYLPISSSALDFRGGKGMIPISWYLAVAAVLFTVGAVTVFVKRNVISIFLAIELMLNSVNLTLVTFSSFFRELGGQVVVFFVMVVAAAEAAVGLAIVILLFRNRETLSVDEASILKL